MFQKKRNTFHGGVHPYEGKELSKDKPIVKAQPGNLLYYAVSQHIGAPAVPTVQKGDHVKEGQELIDRYQRQMHYYSQALERAYGKKVKECYLYSFALGKAVAVEV